MQTFQTIAAARYLLLVIFLVFMVSPSLAQQDTNAVSLSVGNKYYWFSGIYISGNNESVDPRMNTYFYEEIRKDTLIAGKRYAIIFNSYLNSQRFERADSRNVYEWVNGIERRKINFDARRNDTAFNVMSRGITFDNFQFLYAALRTEESPNYSFARNDTSFVFLGIGNNTIVAVVSRKFGLRESSFTERANILRRGVFLHAARIDGQLYGDTLFGQPKTSIIIPPPSPSALAAPNPFSEQMQYSFQTYAPASVSVVVLSASGQIIRSLPAQTLASGKHAYTWDGKDNDGKAAPAGAYIIQVYANDKPLATAKVVKQ